MSDDQRVQPYLHTWTEDGIRRQTVMHYTHIGTTVQYAPRHLDDPLPWFDSNYEFDSDAGRWEDADLVTLGSPDAPGFGVIDPDENTEEDTNSAVVRETTIDPTTSRPVPGEGDRRMAITKVPEVTTQRSLLAALAAIRLEVESRQEELNALHSGSSDLATRFEEIGPEIQKLKVDKFTVGNIKMLADVIGGQVTAAADYMEAADKSVTQADLTARHVRQRHGRIQDAVDEVGTMAAPSYYDADE